MSKALLKQLCGKHAIIILVIIMVIVPSLPASFSSQSGSAIEQVKGSAIPGNANGSSITNSSFHTDILGSRITGYVATGNSTVPINKKVGSLSVVITLKYQDQAGLNSYLQELQDPSSPFYHHYLTHREFVQRYSPPAEVYNSLTSISPPGDLIQKHIQTGCQSECLGRPHSLTAFSTHP